MEGLITLLATQMLGLINLMIFFIIAIVTYILYIRYKYTLVYQIKATEPNLSYWEVFKESGNRMKGYKGGLFLEEIKVALFAFVLAFLVSKIITPLKITPNSSILVILIKSVIIAIPTEVTICLAGIVQGEYIKRNVYKNQTIFVKVVDSEEPHYYTGINQEQTEPSNNLEQTETKKQED